MKFETIELIKKEFHHLDTIFFNSAYFGPSPYGAKQKVSRAVQKELDPSFYNYNNWIGIPERMREQIASLLECSPDNIMHSTSTSDIISIVANGLDFKEGDIACAIDKDYPSNVLAWMRAEEITPVTFQLMNLGDEVVPTAKWLAENLPKNCKVFDMSYVTFDTGKKMNILEIGKLCQERGIFFIVDATQALGGMKITKEELAVIDVLACSSYKWMLGPYGHAFGYFSDNAIKKVKHRTGNWISSPNSKVVYNLLDYTTETLPGARKYDRGQAPNMLVNACLEAGLEFLHDVGLETIQEHNAGLRDYFLENYPKNKFDIITPTDHMANILCLRATKTDALTLERELKFRNVDVSIRQGNLRLSFHIFNNQDQVNELLRALDI
ncbi:MAG: aminotransferase class V-fold PLP-dependent enzyme [Bacteriovoracaceae bacterium]|nr:aminotransferase class V-fold PLP-dependent enzyme [Bacteriovoracaceae bacterium]